MNITNSIKTGVGTRERRKNEGLLPRHECRRMNRAGRKVKKIRRKLFQREISRSFFALFTLNQNQKSDAKLLVLCTLNYSLHPLFIIFPIKNIKSH